MANAMEEGEISLDENNEPNCPTPAALHTAENQMDPFFMQKEPLFTTEAMKMFAQAESGTYPRSILKQPPVKPKANTACMIDTAALAHKQDAFCDQYRWINSGSSSRKRDVCRRRYYLTVKIDSTGKKYGCHSFRKTAIWLASNDRFLILHYQGDESKVVPLPHGSDRRNRPFVSTLPSTRLAAKLAVQDGTVSTKQIYQNLKSELGKNLAQEYEAIAVPRDRKQIENFKNQAQNQGQLSRDEIFSLIEMAKLAFPNDIRQITLHPALNVVFGWDAATKLTKRLLNDDGSIGQVIAYETAVNVGNYYVSIIVAKNTEMEGDPNFPVLFMIHEKKLTKMHAMFWRDHFLPSVGPIPGSTAILVDREEAAVNAIKESVPNGEYNIVLCQNRIESDVKTWLTASRFSAELVKKYIKDLKGLCHCETEDIYESMLEAVRPKWIKAYREYFDECVAEDLLKAYRGHIKHFSAFSEVETGINSMSDSLNRRLKQHGKWTEMPVDMLVYTLLEFQREYLDEFRRGYLAMGEYQSREEFANFDIMVPPNVAETLQRVKDGQPKEPVAITEKRRKSRMTQKEIATLCVDHGLIGFDRTLNVRNVRNPFGQEIHNVRNRQGQYVCSCISSGTCFHIIAVQLLLGEEVQDKKIYKLSRLIKKPRKLGRKSKRPGDVNAKVDEDSMPTKHLRLASTPGNETTVTVYANLPHVLDIGSEYTIA